LAETFGDLELLHSCTFVISTAVAV